MRHVILNHDGPERYQLPAIVVGRDGEDLYYLTPGGSGTASLGSVRDATDQDKEKWKDLFAQIEQHVK